MLREYLPVISAGMAMLIVLSLVPVASHKTQIISAQSGQKCVDPVDGLVNWWDADNVSGTTAEDIKGASDGIMSNVTLVPGKVGQAFSFPGNDFINNNRQDRTGGFVRFPQNFFPYPTTQRGNNPFSFEFWFKTTGDGVMFGQQTAKPWDGHGGWVPGIYVGTDGDLGTEMFWDGRPPVYSNRSVKDGQWHHAAVVYDGTTETVFLDGANIGSTEKNQDPYSQIYHYQLGTGATAGRKGGVGGWHSFKGEIDEFSTYNKALSAGEIDAIVQAGEFGKCKLECGNNFIQDGNNEVCDGTDLGGETCETQKGPGFTGVLTCKNDCSGYDLTTCDAPPLCSDGIDNDADGKIDFPSDPGCKDKLDGDETDPKPKPIDRPVSFSKSSTVNIQILPPLGEREVINPTAPCPTCTITLIPDISTIEGGTPAAAAGFVTIAQINDSSDNSISYTILAVNPADPDKAYTEHTQLFTSDGKEYTNVQR